MHRVDVDKRMLNAQRYGNHTKLTEKNKLIVFSPLEMPPVSRSYIFWEWNHYQCAHECEKHIHERTK